MNLKNSLFCKECLSILRIIVFCAIKELRLWKVERIDYILYHKSKPLRNQRINTEGNTLTLYLLSLKISDDARLSLISSGSR